MRVAQKTALSWHRLARQSLSCQFFFSLAKGVDFPSMEPLVGDHSRSRPPWTRGTATTRTPPAAVVDGPAALPTPEETRMTRDARTIMDAAIQAVDPVVAVHNKLSVHGRAIHVNGGNDHHHTNHHENDNNHNNKIYNLPDYNCVKIVGFGKASSAMATAVLDRVVQAKQNCGGHHQHDLVISGVVIVKDHHATEEQKQYLAAHNITVWEASHPVPDQRSVQASRQLLQLVGNYNNNYNDNNNKDSAQHTLVIACISGGGSALFCAPHERLSLNDLQQTNTALLQSGWNIQDMNVVRKRLEQGKGGRLAAAAGRQSHVLSLILSDVLGDPLDLIASGPTVMDTSTWHDAWEKVQKQLPPHIKLPDAVMDLLRDGKDNKVPDTPSSLRVFSNCHNVLVGNNALAVTAAAHKAKELGYHPMILGTHLDVEAKEAAGFLVSLAQHSRHGRYLYNPFAAKFPLALIVGGETTVTLPSDEASGKGGRNQELALAAAILLNKLDLRQVVVASVGTDGTDGPTDAAGAIVDGGTIDRLSGSAFEALQNHNAYPYLGQRDELGSSPLVKVRHAESTISTREPVDAVFSTHIVFFFLLRRPAPLEQMLRMSTWCWCTITAKQEYKRKI